MDEQKDSCRNCKFYNRFYSIVRARLKYTGSGSCRDHFMTPKERRTIPDIYDCKAWQPEDEQAELYTGDIENKITHMIQQLQDILLILHRE